MKMMSYKTRKYRMIIEKKYNNKSGCKKKRKIRNLFRILRINWKLKIRKLRYWKKRSKRRIG